MLEWSRGRNLAKYNEVLFAYNASGIRQEKTANTVVHKYHLEGTRIHKETYENNTLWYYYDQTGVTGLEYNGSKYYFQKNIQNDIVRIFDQYGILVASYEYDAWGNHKVLNANGFETTEATFIGNINPFRYRGYYYDIETGLYYLNSRYYDPRTCRFINADNYELVLMFASMPGQINMFAYCNNNPVMFTDKTGEGAFVAVLILAAVLILFSGDKHMPSSESIITERDLNINNSNPEGTIIVKIDASGIEIIDSYKITKRQDKRKILEIIMNSSEYHQYQYNRSIKSYLAEWEVHNHAYSMGFMKDNAQHVFLNKDFTQSKMEEFIYTIYGFVFRC